MSEYQGCHKCKYGNKQPTDYPCLECEHNRIIDHYKPMTNAYRIRNFSDEELAEFLLKVNTAYAQPCMISGGDCKWEDYPTHDKGCKDCFLEWLQAEVKEVNT